MTENNHCWAIILAAGASSRFGSPKALAPWKDGTLLSSILETAKNIYGTNIIVVTGGHADEIKNALEAQTLTVFNEQWEQGLGSSIAAGVIEVLKRDNAAEIISIIPVDQPFINGSHLQGLIKQAYGSDKCVLSQDKETIGPPAAVPKRFFSKLQGLTGPRGIKSIFEADEIIYSQSENVLFDIDNPDDLKTALSIVTN
jgi:molybdenum cofactor cytidylyltransferase